MFNIKTVTMKFDPLEDRLKMDCSDNYKNTQRLWLTKRLLDRCECDGDTEGSKTWYEEAIKVLSI